MIRDSKGKQWPIRLRQAAEVRVLRGQKIRSEAHPYDPVGEPYLEARRTWKMGLTLAGRSRIEYLWKGQGGKCVACGQPLSAADQAWHVHHRNWRCYGGQDTFANLELLHDNCHRQIQARSSDGRIKPRPARGVGKA